MAHTICQKYSIYDNISAHPMRWHVQGKEEMRPVMHIARDFLCLPQSNLGIPKHEIMTLVIGFGERSAYTESAISGYINMEQEFEHLDFGSIDQPSQHCTGTQ